MKRNGYRIWLIAVLITGILFLTSCDITDQFAKSVQGTMQNGTAVSIPEYQGEPYIILNENMPMFEQSDMTQTSFEQYSELDSLGRCGVAFANVGMDLMPTEDRESISQIKPTGWQSVQYENVDGKYLYNRCHLIGYQLTAENANEKNLITGTRYMNVEGMLPFENMVADYVKETNHHVLYRVTPIFSGSDLVAQGVEIEAYSVEDQGEAICFHVFVYNVQPGITIDYATGESWTSEVTSTHYVLNTSSKKFHLPECSGVRDMNGSNRQDYQGSRAALVEQGYSPCGLCHP